MRKSKVNKKENIFFINIEKSHKNFSNSFSKLYNVPLKKNLNSEHFLCAFYD